MILQMHANLSSVTESQLLQGQLTRLAAHKALIGQSLPMRCVIASIEQVAPTNASVVIVGESGTGKELVARTIHELSARAYGPYVGINCAALPETLMESELFGHERGAFTGADRRREGCFELANGGTLLLDEIAEIRPELQAKLLRVIEERKIRRLGGICEVPVDVRVLAATNRNLEKRLREGKFREDLYYRLNVFSIVLPSLRERLEDLPALIEAFLRQLSPPGARQIAGIEAECLELLKSQRWPGNVRQLRNVIERALVVTQGPMISIADLSEEITTTRNSCDVLDIHVGMSLDAAKRQLILQTLKATGGNRIKAAEILGVTIKTIYNQLKSYEAGLPTGPDSAEVEDSDQQ
jgi:transcriptional regulator with PAS, ATPase and Fis domain